jgi:cytidine deaminase
VLYPLDAPAILTSNSSLESMMACQKPNGAAVSQAAHCMQEKPVPGTDLPVPERPLLSAEQRATLLHLAKAALVNAYAPFSKFRVGAALLTEAGAFFSGCNVENSSYGLTNCAERTAIFSAVASEGPGMRIRALAVWTRPECPCSPCGACRQVIYEFGPDAIVLFHGKDGVEEARASDLLPFGFAL